MAASLASFFLAFDLFPSGREAKTAGTPIGRRWRHRSTACRPVRPIHHPAAGSQPSGGTGPRFFRRRRRRLTANIPSLPDPPRTKKQTNGGGGGGNAAPDCRFWLGSTTENDRTECDASATFLPTPNDNYGKVLGFSKGRQRRADPRWRFAENQSGPDGHFSSQTRFPTRFFQKTPQKNSASHSSTMTRIPFIDADRLWPAQKASRTKALL